uniref:EGF-like domain-containing protein n=1 Tax=Biomphalaria glabrata TaxID=6526 RepID=A0A2C9KWD0_BIOGL
MYQTLDLDCALGLWGSQCSNDCGNCEGGKAFCQVTNGLCVNGCARGYQGRDCKTPCPPGTHGQYCVYKCGSCSDVRPVCDPVSGMCQAGCKTGFQKPHCKLACPFYTWGDDCSNNCSCKKPPIECSCHPETGQCEPCGPNQKSLRFSMPVNNPECLNQFALDEAVKFYTPPSVLNIPWKPVAAIFLLLILFVFTYYIYWSVHTISSPIIFTGQYIQISSPIIFTGQYIKSHHLLYLLVSTSNLITYYIYWSVHQISSPIIFTGQYIQSHHLLYLLVSTYNLITYYIYWSVHQIDHQYTQAHAHTFMVIVKLSLFFAVNNYLWRKHFRFIDRDI